MAKSVFQNTRSIFWIYVFMKHVALKIKTWNSSAKPKYRSGHHLFFSSPISEKVRPRGYDCLQQSCLLTYSTVQSPSWVANWLQLVKKFPAFHGTRRFITTITSVRHLSRSWASPIQSIYPHPTSWRSILILSTHLLLGLPSGLFPSGFPAKTLYTPLFSPIRATCPTHLISAGMLLEFT